jgi:dipeptidyl aminopeptidase/acylaminoacyl peptidase
VGFRLVSVDIHRAHRDGVEPKGLPLVLLVHGGPWSRDSWGFNPEAQLLANRGYAVLRVNFRGSTGYGKAFVNVNPEQT